MEQKPGGSSTRWEWKVSTRVNNATPDQIFALYRDFFNINTWLPVLPTSYGVHGTNGEVGCIRYCAGSAIPSRTGEPVSWTKERILAVDPGQRVISYDIVDCNTVLKSYLSTVRIVPGGGDENGGCVIEWCVAVDPIEGSRLEDFVAKYQNALELMAKTMEDSIAKSGDTK